MPDYPRIGDWNTRYAGASDAKTNRGSSVPRSNPSYGPTTPDASKASSTRVERTEREPGSMWLGSAGARPGSRYATPGAPSAGNSLANRGRTTPGAGTSGRGVERNIRPNANSSAKTTPRLVLNETQRNATTKALRQMTRAKSVDSLTRGLSAGVAVGGVPAVATLGASTAACASFSWFNSLNLCGGCFAPCWWGAGCQSGFAFSFGASWCWGWGSLSCSFGNPWGWCYPYAYCGAGYPWYGGNCGWYGGGYGGYYPYYSYPIYPYPSYAGYVEVPYYVNAPAQEPSESQSQPSAQSGNAPSHPAENQTPAPGGVPTPSLSNEKLADRYVSLGDMYFQLSRYDRSLEAYQKAVHYDPADANLRFILCDALFANGKFGDAAEEIRAALRIDPGLVESRADKRKFYSRMTDFDAQLAVLEDWLRNHPDNADGWLVLGYNRYFRDELERSRDAFMRCRTLPRERRATRPRSSSRPSTCESRSVTPPHRRPRRDPRPRRGPRRAQVTNSATRSVSDTQRFRHAAFSTRGKPRTKRRPRRRFYCVSARGRAPDDGRNTYMALEARRLLVIARRPLAKSLDRVGANERHAAPSKAGAREARAVGPLHAMGRVDERVELRGSRPRTGLGKISGIRAGSGRSHRSRRGAAPPLPPRSARLSPPRGARVARAGVRACRRAARAWPSTHRAAPSPPLPPTG